MNTKRLALAAAAVSALTASALADSVDLQFIGTGLGRNVMVHLSGSSTYVFAGQLYHNFSDGQGAASSLDGNLLTYCCELTQYVSQNKAEYELVPVEDAPSTAPMGDIRAQALRDLYAYADGDQFVTQNTEDNRDFTAAFQIAVWEIVYDYDGTLASLDIGDGELIITDRNAGGLRTGIEGFLADLFGAIGLGADFPELYAVINPCAQDQLVMIPLPAPFAMAAVGLAAVAWRRRKLARASASI